MTSAFEVFHGVQPWEEQQSPSPVETTSNPYETSLAPARSRSGGKPSKANVVSPIDTNNPLQRQFSPDPESPPAAWKRRPSIVSRSSQAKSSTSPISISSTGTRSARSLSESSYYSTAAPSSRRHPGLMMTAAAEVLNESPDSASLYHDEPLPMPQPSFRRRSGHSSARSSITSQDLSGMSSEELWRLGQEGDAPDLSNPTRQAAERPLDTVRRLSRTAEQARVYHSGLPVEVIWPTPPPLEIVPPPPKSKSLTNVPSLARKSTKKARLAGGRKSVDVSAPIAQIPVPHNKAKSTPTSPISQPPDQVYISSAHSSSTSLTSHSLGPTKSMGALNAMARPPSTYYSRDFLSTLAPREGGYAVAAMMGNGLGAVGTTTVEERRRSMILDDKDAPRPRAGMRAPVSKSAGMGRWSLDGGEQFVRRPYATPSAATTSSNLSAPPINSPAPSPPLEDRASPIGHLPEGASPSAINRSRTEPHESAIPAPLTATVSNPKTPSPLSQQTTPADLTPQSATPIPTPVSTSTPTNAPPQPPKTKKQLAKEAKAAEKEAKAAAVVKKQQQKIADIKAKEDAKRAEKMEKERRKQEAKKAKLTSPSTSRLPFSLKKEHPPPLPADAAKKVEVATASASVPLTLVTSPLTDDHPEPIASLSTGVSMAAAEGEKPKPFPSSSQSAYKVPVVDQAPHARAPRRSMPNEGAIPPRPAPSLPQPASQFKVSHMPTGIDDGSRRSKGKSRLSLFGTIRKKLSGGGEASSSNSSFASRSALSTSRPASATSTIPKIPPIVPEKDEPVVIVGSGGSSAKDDNVHPIGQQYATSQTTLPNAGPSSDVEAAPQPAPIEGLPAPTEVMDGLESSATIHRSTSHEVLKGSAEMSELTKSVSHEPSSSTIGASPVRIKARPGSLTGPRPMPSTSRGSPRPSSVASRSVETASPSLPAVAQGTSPLQPPTTILSEPITPSTSVGDSSIFSHTISNASTSLTSHGTGAGTGAEGENRKSSVTYDNEEIPNLSLKEGMEEPVRESSTETMHASPRGLEAVAA